MSADLALLLSLPLELRQQIYTYLLPRENTSHPLPSVGITSVSRRPPSLALLTIHSTITKEILDVFYSIATWKLIFSHALNFFRTDPELDRLEASPVLKRMKNVEVVFFQDILLLKEYPSYGLHSFCTEIRRRADRAVDVLLQASDLRSVTVSWIDTTLTGDWGEKARILEPLRRLTGVDFRIGDVQGLEFSNRDAFVKAMEDVLGARDKVCRSVSEKDRTEEPASLRMLAFDVRQERAGGSWGKRVDAIRLGSA